MSELTQPAGKEEAGTDALPDYSQMRSEIRREFFSDFLPCPMPISPEFDSIRANYFVESEEFRGDWMLKLLRERPDIAQFRERVMPIERSAGFARCYLPQSRILDQRLLLSLISQHFRTLGLVHSQSALHEEWGYPFEIPKRMNYSQLNILLQRGMRHAERFWNLTMNPNEETQNLLQAEISKVIGGDPAITNDTQLLEQEKPDDPAFYTATDGNLSTASLNQLVWMTTTDSQFYSPQLVTAVCLTYSSFTTADILFSKLHERVSIAMKETPASKRTHSFELILTFFFKWIKESGKEIDAHVLVAVKDFLEKEVKPLFPRLFARIFEEQYSEGAIEQIDYSTAPKVEIGNDVEFWTGQFSIFSLPDSEFARQLTVVTANLFCSIKRSEFLEGSWENPRKMHRSPNIVSINLLSNAFNQWALKQIENPPSGKSWVDIITFFIRACRCLYKMQNYLNSLWLIWLVDNLPSSKRKQLNTVIDGKLWDWFEKVQTMMLDSEDNYTKPIELSSAGLKSGKPCLPALVYYLNRLSKFSSGVSSMRSGQIDVVKSMEIFGMIQNVLEFQKAKYVFLPIAQVQDLFREILG